MGKRLTGLVVFGVILGIAGSVSAGLVAHWKLDDGAGTVAADSGGGGFHGTLIGGPTWVAGTDGGALQFDGSNDYVDFGNPAGWPAGRSPRSMTGWGKTDTIAAGYRWMAAYGSASTGQAMFIGLNGSTLVAGGYGGDDVTVANTWIVGEWCHVGLTYDGTTAKAYLNGREIGSLGKNWNLALSRAHIGRQVNDAAEFWDGAVDDVRIYDHVLTAAEMKALVPPKVKARKPNPADGSVGVFMPLFTWTPGETALFEDVYLGTNPELTAADRVATHQPAMLKMYYHLQPLAAGQTYYWRVDAIEANGTVHTGDVWSFTVMPKTAWAPKPADGATYVDPETALSWSPGFNATGHEVYLGTDRAAVGAGSADAFKGDRPLTYAPGALTRGATYYWRVDEVAGGVKVPGAVWSFTVRPVIPKTDPTLVGWWKLEDEGSGNAVDYSGSDHYGALMGGPAWVEGYYGEALHFDGADDYVDLGSPQDWPAGAAPRTMCAWAMTDSTAAGWKWIAACGSPATGQAMFIGLNGTALYGGGYGDDVNLDGFWQTGVWHHIGLTYDGTTARLYADGAEVTSAAKTWNLSLSRAHIGRQVNTLVEFWEGAIDDVRIYNVALTPAQIAQVMRGDPLLAWDPQPKSGFNVDIRDAASLQWSAGEKASKHDVYFGTDKNAVRAADTSSPEYQGRQTGANFPLAGLVRFDGGSYFWRIDEVEADGATVHKGVVWGFTIPGYLIVDEFEGYTDVEGSRIYESWIDGWTNSTGSQVGYLQAPFAERTVVHDGRQSMPMDYNNTKTPFYSETEREFSPVQDWTAEGVDTLTLSISGVATNGAGKLYVAVEDSAGKIAVATSDLPLTVPAWTAWSVPLSQFTGVNLSRIKTLYLGVGNRQAPVQGGAGRLYLDDIRLTVPAAPPQ